ncbi:MAG: Pentapeptide repeats (8 copies) [Microgenomates bacterium OLB22]|nr:MAG: Pentapeptide repeats (8 copies) [Microgenomates bacterium OLB22]
MSDKTRLNWAETRDLLIENGVNPDLLPTEWHPGIDLRGVQLMGAQLQGVFLRAVDLRGANMIGSDLSYADFSYAVLV